MRYVYAEELILLNFFIDFILLYITNLFTKIKINILQLIFSAFLGGIYVLLCFYYQEILSLFFKLIISIIMCAIVVGTKNKKLLFTYYLNFIFASFLLASIILFLNYFLEDSFTFSNQIIYSYSSYFLLIAGCIFLFLVIPRFIKYMNSKNQIESFKYDCLLNLLGEEINLKAYLDSGNFLKTLLGKSIILVNKNKIQAILPNELNEEINSLEEYLLLYEKLPNRIKNNVTYSYMEKINKGKKIILCLKVEGITVLNYKNMDLKIEGIFLGLVNDFENKEFDMLLPFDFFINT